MGRLDITTPDYQTLSERQTSFASSMSALRNKNNPKSENLSSMVSTIVSDLEDHFDTYDDDKRGVPCLRLGQARRDARDSTCKELPKIKKTGQDIFHDLGYSGALYLSDKEASSYKFSAKDTARPILLRSDGAWKSDVEIRLALMTEAHPPLPKPSHIKRSNGHYTYNHNARPVVPRKGLSLKEVSTVQEAPELKGILGDRLGGMEEYIQSLKNR